MSAINSFQGMVSLFFPMNPWLSPAGAALSLPLNRHVTHLIAFSILWLEAAISSYALFRVIGLDRLGATLSVQLYMLLSFPMYSYYLGQFSHQAGMAMTAHNIALLNVATLLFLLVGKGKDAKTNVFLVAYLFAALLYSFYSMPMIFLAHLPVYGLFAIAASLAVITRQDAYWKLFTILTCLVGAYLAGIVDFYAGTILGSARLLYYSGFEKGSLLDGIRSLGVTLCPEHPHYATLQLLGVNCWYQPSLLPQILALLGAVAALLRRGHPLRMLAAGYLAWYGILVLYVLLSSINWVDVDRSRGHLVFLYWPGLPFLSLFAVSGVRDGLFSLLGKLSDGVSPDGLSRKPELIVLLSLPLLAAMLFLARTELQHMLSPRVEYHLWRSTHPSDSSSPIIAKLVEDVRLKPGSEFRGSVASYFGAKGSLLVEKFPSILEEYDKFPSIFKKYERIGDFWVSNFGNSHFGQHLWFFDIPTIEEYGQYTAPLAVGLFAHVFGNLYDVHDPNYLFVNQLNVPVLEAFGVRYIISDQRLSDAGVTLRFIQPSRTNPPAELYLYETGRPNLGNYSPTRTVVAVTAEEAVKHLVSARFAPEKEVVVQDGLGVSGPFLPARRSVMVFERNAVRIRAESEGRSMLLLPVNFSNCWTAEPAGKTAALNGVRLIRGNLIQLVVVFDREVDARLRYRFGPFGHTDCRVRDIADYRALKWEFFAFEKFVRVR